MKRMAFFILLVMMIIQISYVEAQEFDMDENYFECISYRNEPKIQNETPIIEAGSAIALDHKSGRILYQKNASTRVAIASTTKIMTSIVALENANLNDMVTISKRAANIGGSSAKLKENEQLTLKELLYGLMLNSGNDAAIAVAEHVGKDVPGFVKMMNNKARELGLKDTQFMNPHGLDTDGHYSTAYELSLMAKYALGNSNFREIVKSSSAWVKNRGLHNTNEMLSLYPGADGVKTGYTSKAGRCLVTSATRNNWQVISVVLNCSTKKKRTQNSRDILEYVFNNFKNRTMIRDNQVIGNLPVSKGMMKSVSIVAQQEVTFPIKDDEAERIKIRVDVPKTLVAPVYENVEVGNVKYYLDNQLLAKVPVETSKDVKEKYFYNYFFDMLQNLINIF